MKIELSPGEVLTARVALAAADQLASERVAECRVLLKKEMPKYAREVARAALKQWEEEGSAARALHVRLIKEATP